ncbi:hypothetical protein [Alkalimarinus alittae]|uniref:Secreted protein n=1 Tax=Alkalimarinus alittae TaxID=2961619 RepID=A0ABY6N2P6_9ALTE|nr:hypothetical protein [Alkalimarinus alittae]UZE96386.1 hypothetical protein NKI27_01170 [Alkalimarinus alittae]
MFENFKALLLLFSFVFSLLLAGCSSNETSSPAADVDSVKSSAPAEMEERAYHKTVDEKEEAEKLKKQKISDDDMERLD